MPLSYLVILVKPGLHGVKFKDELRAVDGDVAALRTMFASLCYMKQKETDAAEDVCHIGASVYAFHKP